MIQIKHRISRTCVSVWEVKVDNLMKNTIKKKKNVRQSRINESLSTNTPFSSLNSKHLIEESKVHVKVLVTRSTNVVWKRDRDPTRYGVERRPRISFHRRDIPSLFIERQWNARFKQLNIMINARTTRRRIGKSRLNALNSFNPSNWSRSG